jgi:signal peptidase I
MRKLFIGIIIIALIIGVPIAVSAITFVPYLSPAIHVVTTGEKVVVSVSEAMEPTIMKGGFIYYKPATFDQVKVDDIILFKETGQNILIVGRVTDATATELTVKGDANPAPYPWKATPELLEGIVTEIHNP